MGNIKIIKGVFDTKLELEHAEVVAGFPDITVDYSHETLDFNRDYIKHPEASFYGDVEGDSMKDAGICQGDMVKVVCDDCPQDGDIVLASIDGESTIKTYCEDEEGFPWLVPQNSNYTPIPLKDKMNVRIVGRISEIIKNAPRMSYRDCQRMIKKAKMAMAETHEIPQQRVSWAIREIAPMVKIARQWYAVHRAMADLNVVKDGDYEKFCNMVKVEVPQHSHLPKSDELQRLAMLSFTKPVRYWNAENAPVKGKRFNDYLMIANRTTELLKGG